MEKDHVYVIKPMDGLFLTLNRLQSAPNVILIARLAMELQLINALAAKMIKSFKMVNANAVQGISRLLKLL